VQDVGGAHAEDVVQEVHHGAGAVHAVRAVDENGAGGVLGDEAEDLRVGRDHGAAIVRAVVALVDEVVVHHGVVGVVAVGAEHGDVHRLRAGDRHVGLAAICVAVRRSMTRFTWYFVARVAAPSLVILSRDSVRSRRGELTSWPLSPVNDPSSRPLTRPGTSVMAWSFAVSGAG
jgi:hypothetical protein